MFLTEKKSVVVNSPASRLVQPGNQVHLEIYQNRNTEINLKAGWNLKMVV